MSTPKDRAANLARLVNAVLGEDDAHICCGYGPPCVYHTLRAKVKSALEEVPVRYELSANEWPDPFSTSPALRTTSIATMSTSPTEKIPSHLPPTPEPDASPRAPPRTQPPPQPVEKQRSSFSWRMSSIRQSVARAPSIYAPSIMAPSFRSQDSNSLVELEADYPATIQMSFQIDQDMFSKQDGCLTVMSPDCEWLGFFRKNEMRLYRRVFNSPSNVSQGNIRYEINAVNGTSSFVSGAALLTNEIAVFSNPFLVWHLTKREHIFNRECHNTAVCALAASPSGRYIAVASKTKSGSRIQLIEYESFTRTIKVASAAFNVNYEITALHISDSSELILGLNRPSARASGGKTEREGFIRFYTLTPASVNDPASFTFRGEAVLGMHGTADDRGITRIVRPSSPTSPQNNLIAVSTWTQTCPPALFRLSATYAFERIKISTSNVLANKEARIQSMAMTPSGGNLVIVGGKNEIFLYKTGLLDTNPRPRRIGVVRRAGSPREGVSVGWAGEEECFVTDRGGKVQWFLLGT